jgi:hypothetical protein
LSPSYQLEPASVKQATSSGNVIGGNEDPGWLTVFIEPPPGYVCDPSAAQSGLPVDGEPNALRTKLKSGLLTNVIFACAKKP